MTGNCRCKRNRNLRVDIEEALSTIPVGTIIQSHSLINTLSTRRRSVNMRNVGNLLRERSDIQWLEDGLWKKVK
jgi:hypothetical protein